MLFNWIGFQLGTRCERRQRNYCTVGLRLECLEDRTVPSTFAVTTTLDVTNPTDGKRSLREAITQANNHPGADVITIPAGLYKLGITGAGENSNASGDFDMAH